MPIRTGNCNSRCAATAASTADLGEANAATTPSPVWLNKNPSFISMAVRNTLSCATTADPIASASASHRRVDPSISVNRNVTTPKGAGAVMASPRPTRYVLRSQAFSPLRGSGPNSRDRRCRRHGLVPVVPAAAAARCRAIAGPRRWDAPLQQLSLAEQMVDGGAHERYGVIAISTPSPLTRQVHLDER